MSRRKLSVSSGTSLPPYAATATLWLSRRLSAATPPGNLFVQSRHPPLQNLSGHCKSGQRWSGQNRPTEVAGDSVVLPCLRLWRQVSFRTPAPWTAFEYMPMMQKAVEHGGDGSAVSQQL